MNDPENTSFVIIGGGPVGLLAALAIRKVGQPVVVYERRLSLEQSLEESYPIGVTQRGLRALRILSPDSAVDIEASGVLVDSWDVYVRGRRVARVPSGTTLGHTRFSVADVLYAQARDAGIKVRFGHALTSFDVDRQSLTFSVTSPAGGSKQATPKNVVVDCRKTIVIAADGAGSAMRGLVAKHYSPLRNLITPWGIHFRVLVMDVSDIDKVPLDPESHSIHTGVYCALIGPPEERRWVVVPSAKQGDPHAEWFFLSSADPPSSAMAALRSHIAAAVPPLTETEQFFSDDEIRAFFSRRVFTGNLVSLAPLHYPFVHEKETVSEGQGNEGAVAEVDSIEPHQQPSPNLASPLLSQSTDSRDTKTCTPWIVFLGDAAHSVFPATGEGLNSGLDDVLVFCQSVLWPSYGVPSASATAASLLPLPGPPLLGLSSTLDSSTVPIDLAAYTVARQQDVDALETLAGEILSMTTGPPSVRATGVLTNILASCARALHLIGPSEAELRYGPETDTVLLPYREVLRRHIHDTAFLHRLASAIVTIFVLLGSLFRKRET